MNCVFLPVLQPQTSKLAVPPIEPPNATAPDPILTEFDPLVCDPVEKNARDAWENAESHPPPPLIPIKGPSNPSSTVPIWVASPPSELLQKDEAISEPPSQQPVPKDAQSPPTASSAFPSLASLTRSLTRSPRRSVTPTLPVPPRTSSLRHAHHASLPSMPSNFTASASTSTTSLRETASQTPSASDGQRDGSPTITSTDAARSTGSPRSDGLFDFQKFLDQMKTKGADPIAKYLRR